MRVRPENAGFHVSRKANIGVLYSLHDGDESSSTEI
jgi:hypothetical protein